MRVPSSSSAVVSRPSESKSLVAPKPAVESGATAQKKIVPGHSIVDGGCFPPFPVKPGADTRTRAKQGDQLHDIADGVRSGSLTEKETQALLKEQEAIANAQKAAMADGKLSLAEQFKLSQMQQRAERNIEQARSNRDRDFFASRDSDAQRQAAQIDQIADGRTNGNITNSEAGKLLGQQASIADARDNGGKLGGLVTDMKQDQAQKDIERHSAPGTQFDWKPLPQPLPFPRPEPKPWPELPRPMPLPFPRPEFPNKPDFVVPLNRVIYG